MRIYFERSGGFMGMHIEGIVDTNSLPSEEAKSIHELIDAASFFDLPEAPTSSTEGADQFQYKLFVDDQEQGRKHSIQTTDSAAPDTLRPLLRKLTIITRSSHSASTDT